MKLSKNIVSVILFIIIFCCFLNTANAQNNNSSNLIIIINVKPQMQIGDNLEFSYTMISPKDLSLKFTPHIECPQAPVAMVREEEANIIANIPYEGKYFSMELSDLVEPQKCVAGIKITEPFQKTKTAGFQIIADPTLDLEILLCKDEKCAQKSRVYQIGDTLYLNYKIEISGIKSEATITAPDNSTKNIILPGNYALKEKGIYNISVVSKADNYKDNTQDFKITVLAGEIKVNDQRICNSDGKCAGQEDGQNCPQDCAKVKKPIGKIIILIIAIVIIIAIIIAACYFLSRKKAAFTDGNER